ncbi:MAG: hypothetical protein ACLGHX_09860 [Acidimicrobiia bacterium]
MTDRPAGYERVQLLDDAIDDLRIVASRSPGVLREVLRQLKMLDQGVLEPQPLHDFAKTGDVTDCGKIVVALPDEPEHRIVVRTVDGVLLVYEVVAVEDRTQDLPYLLAGLRLERIQDPIRKSDALRRVHRVRRLLGE